ncbi:glucose 1-dehydrogenase [Psychrobacter sp. I-STPA6b]|uniref:glucose 1-dehydrogenase n=1 Tax=Psychrobacter sp. I-STPA6b TaxID=2585718 RepID=UPI001D0CD5BE|nr:glucose 1-dehydrogenase [Psychrobacter sp. I-STPA6b]
MNIQELWNLSNKVAIVTGGANGIGKASALMLAQAGADVAIGDLDMDDAEKVAQQIRDMGRKAIAVSCNILKDEEMVKAVADTVEQLGGVHILVNVAGGGGGGREVPEKIDVTDIERDFKLNVYSAWRMIQLCAPHMQKAGGGSVINIASMGAVTTSPGMSGYASSKAAVVHMGANLAFDYPHIRINAIGPGATRTHALETVLTPEIEKAMLARTPIKRLGEPEDIAGAVLYFAAPISSWVNGQVLYVNGGGVQTLA